MESVLLEQGRRFQMPTLYGLGAVSILGENLYPSVYNQAAYWTVLNLPAVSSALRALEHAYRSMSAAFLADLNSIHEARSVSHIPIPPIPLLIFSRVSRPSEILEETLELRKRLSPVRKAFREYADRIRGDDVSIKESLDAILMLSQVTHEASLRYGEAVRRKLFEWKDIADLVPDDLDLSGADVQSLTQFFLKKPLNWITFKLRHRRFLPLYSLRKDALSAPEYANVICKVWGADANSEVQEKFQQSAMNIEREELELDLRTSTGYSRGMEAEWSIFDYTQGAVA